MQGSITNNIVAIDRKLLLAFEKPARQWQSVKSYMNTNAYLITM